MVNAILHHEVPEKDENPAKFPSEKLAWFFFLTCRLSRRIGRAV